MNSFADTYVAKVALDKVTFHVDIPYTYKIPTRLREGVFLGQRVLVPFGRGNTKRQAVVLEINKIEKKPAYKLKEIIAKVDKTPIISSEMLKLAFWIKEQTFCTFYEAFSLMIPTGMNMKFDVKYLLNGHINDEEYTKNQSIIIDKIKENKNEILEKDLFEFLDIKKETKDIKDLISKKALIKKHEITQRTKDDSILKVQLNEDIDDIKVTKKQQEVIDVLKTENNISLKDVLYKSGTTRIVVDNLSKKRVLKIYEKEVFRNPYKYDKKPEEYNIKLSKKQKDAYDGLLSLLESKKPEIGLLFGVTGSGKTLVYLELIKKTLEEKKQVIFLVPEISLTSQTIKILQKYFGDEIAVLHSGLSLGERLDEYKRLQQGYANIAVGTRSAIFAPFNDIGLIIMDEEQEYTYKSEQTPRYHTRNVAKFRCNEHKALLVLGSATPSIESYYNAKEGNYNLFEIDERFGVSTLPQVYLIDMNEEKTYNGSNVISNELEEEINYNLLKKEQMILLLNRRGFNTIVTCNNCGEKVLCENCSIALTYHKANGKLVCHYCGLMKEFPKTCSSCGSLDVRALGLGTQRVEEAIEETFKNANVLRMDQDTTMAKNAHEIKLNDFRNKKYDIMIGTQMVAKGLDFENVTLVGVLNADQSLYSTDFRAYEKTFSLITQVVGRSGRGNKEGRAYIQTYTPFNKVLNYGAIQDYKSFYKEEIATRRAMLYPPFSNFTVIGFSGINQKNVHIASNILQNSLKNNAKMKRDIPLRVLGPMPAYIEKIAGKYRYKIIIKCVNNKDTRELFKKTLLEFNKKNESRGITTFIDMDYYGNI